MYIYCISAFCLLFSFVKRGGFICKVIDILFPLILSFSIIYIYFGGEDWFSYYNDYILKPICNNIIDITFLLIIKTIYFLTCNNLVITIYVFFAFCFYFIRYLFICDDLLPILGGIKKYYIFLSITIFILGPSLVMEQLRQFLSVIFLIPFCMYYLDGKNKKSYIYMILALFSHSSSVFFIIITFFIKYINSKNKLFFSLLALGVFIYIGITLLSVLNPYNIPFVSILSNKYMEYYHLYGSDVRIGYIYILNFIFILLYFAFFNMERNNKVENGLSILFISSCVIYLFSLFFPFVTRFLSTGIVFYILFLSMKCNDIYKLKINLSNLYSMFFILMIGVSYYLNHSAPFGFINISKNSYNIPINKVELELKLNAISNSIINKSKALE